MLDKPSREVKNMRKIIHKELCCFFIVIGMLPLLCLPSYAAQFDTLHLEETEVPAYMDIQISDMYVAKEHFSQAQVRDDGWFGLLSITSNTESDHVFAYTYLDFYDESGCFQKAIRMNYSGDIAFELTGENTIDIYIYDYVLRYSLESNAVTAYKGLGYLEEHSELKNALKQNTFEWNGWHYQCKGYVSQFYQEFLRSKDGETQVLVSMGNANNPPWNPVLGLAVGTAAIIAILLLIRKRRKQNQKQVKFTVHEDK